MRKVAGTRIIFIFAQINQILGACLRWKRKNQTIWNNHNSHKPATNSNILVFCYQNSFTTWWYIGSLYTGTKAHQRVKHEILDCGRSCYIIRPIFIIVSYYVACGLFDIRYVRIQTVVFNNLWWTLVYGSTSRRTNIFFFNMYSM